MRILSLTIINSVVELDAALIRAGQKAHTRQQAGRRQGELESWPYLLSHMPCVSRFPEGIRKLSLSKVSRLAVRRSVPSAHRYGLKAWAVLSFGWLALLVLGLVQDGKKAYLLNHPWTLFPLQVARHIWVSGRAGRGSAGQGSI